VRMVDEPLGAAIALGRPDEGGRTLDAEEGDLRLEVVGRVLRSMVVPHGQTAGDRLAEPAEAPSSRPARARRSPGLPRATAEAPLQSCAVGTSCHRGRERRYVRSSRSLRVTRPRSNDVRLIVHGTPLVRKSSACEVSQSTVMRRTPSFTSHKCSFARRPFGKFSLTICRSEFRLRYPDAH
jgi:hypothetical protein